MKLPKDNGIKFKMDKAKIIRETNKQTRVAKPSTDMLQSV